MSFWANLRKLRTKMGPLWWYSALLFIVSRIGDVANLIVGVFLVPAYVPGDLLGAIRPLFLFAGLVATPIAWLILPAEKFLNVFSERGEGGKAKSLLRIALLAVAALSALLVVVLLAFPRQILLRLHLDDPSLLIYVALLAGLACLRPVLATAARAFQRFDAVVISGIPPPFVRILAVWLLMRFWPLKGYLAAQCLCDAAGLAVLGISLARHSRQIGPAVSFRPHLGEMLRYAWPLLLYDLATRFQAPVEALVVRHRLPEYVSGADYLIQTFAAIPAFFGDAITAFLFPLFSSRFEKGTNTGRMLGQSMAVTTLLGLAFAAFLTVVAPWLFWQQSSWAIALPYAGLLGWAALTRAMRSTTNCFVIHEHACRDFRYLWYYLPLQVIQTGGLYCLAGWDAFRPLLPAALWDMVAAWPRLTLGFIVAWGAAWQAITLFAILIHLAIRQRNRMHRPHPAQPAKS